MTDYSTQNSSISNVSVGSDDFRKTNVSVGLAKEMNKKEGHYWNDQCKTRTFAIPRGHKKRVAGTVQAIGLKMRKLNDPSVQSSSVTIACYPYGFVTIGDKQMGTIGLKSFWLEENKIDGTRFHDIGSHKQMGDTYTFTIMPYFQCISNVGQDKQILVNHLKRLLQMEVMKDRNGKLLF